MINEALRLIRVYHDMKQTEAAKQLGISKSYISELEKGTKTPTLDLIDRYAQTFEIPSSSILFFSENLGSQNKYEKSRTFVASKILSLLKFLEDKSSKADA
ncbi:helix-turn-helix domain-containing protein [Afifella sp. JA880]|uniref:helix-turn-helix transcriptional regulator n=1 Tax=Afifella sp. JA880 TaxID=2975280 RepID=UPI0021BBAC92|nr:helix-turn-helix transcriptional regulator [Afifella sp. JA880]MCT8266842.1 helix-turn-helix domain-containing protein [Afifella sp. JA880]